MLHTAMARSSNGGPVLEVNHIVNVGRHSSWKF